MNIEDEWKVNKIARLLPPPLYMVYANITAFAETCDPQLSATINGDEFEANQLEGSDAPLDGGVAPTNKNADRTPDEDDAMESDNDDEESRPTKKSHHHRHQSKTVQGESKRDRLFKPHPLSVTFSIQSRSPTLSTLNVTLYYLHHLNIVTAKCSLHLTGNNTTSTDGAEVVCAATILNALSAGDLGKESCNPTTHFQMRDSDLDPSTFASVLQAKDLGKPYQWAQQLCGLDFVSATGGVSLQLTQSAVPQIVRQIRQRWQHRLDLLQHMQRLIRSKVSTTSNSVSTLLHWGAIGYDAYADNASTQRLVEQRVVDRQDLLYRVLVARGVGARLECAVRISINHPVEAPLWAITLHRKNDSWTATNNATVRVS